jgi:hypothetical protein
LNPHEEMKKHPPNALQTEKAGLGQLSLGTCGRFKYIRKLRGFLENSENAQKHSKSS